MPAGKEFCFKELSRKGITLTDFNETFEFIHVLIGANVLKKLLKGCREIFSSGLVALDTYLDWTLMGKIPQGNTPKENYVKIFLEQFHDCACMNIQERC